MPNGAESSSGPFPKRRDLRASLAPETSFVVDRDEVLTALPRSSEPARTGAPPAPPRRTMGRLLLSAVALSCAGGLLMTMALPVVGSPAPEEPAAALPQQELASSAFTLHDSFEALGAVSAEAAGDPVDFINFADAEVQFPFASGQPLTDGFGPRDYPVAGMHDAQDFAAPAGTTVQAIARGRVLEVGGSSDGCGFGVRMQHTIDGLKVTSRYCHLEWGSNELEIGQWANVGDPVGRVGATGLAFGAHLHFALTIDGTAVDPMPFLTKYNRQTRSP